MLNDGINLKGKLTVIVTGEDGTVKDRLTKDNLIVTAGKEFVASRITTNDASPMNFVAVGSDNTIPGAGDTTLTTETARVSATAGYSGVDATWTASFGAGVGTGTIAEAGIFNAGGGGDMLSHVNGLSVTKGASDTLTVTWTVTVG